MRTMKGAGIGGSISAFLVYIEHEQEEDGGLLGAKTPLVIFEKGWCRIKHE